MSKLGTAVFAVGRKAFMAELCFDEVPGYRFAVQVGQSGHSFSGDFAGLYWGSGSEGICSQRTVLGCHIIRGSIFPRVCRFLMNYRAKAILVSKNLLNAKRAWR